MNQLATPNFDFSGTSFEKRFRAINRERLRRVHESLSARQSDFVEMLPLLFHYNHPLLPGYVTKDTPFGIPDYGPSQASLRAVRRLCRSFELDRRSPPRYAIRGLYLMGSPGTIAYSKSSDLDLWLVHDPDLPAPAIDELTRKASRIEDFAADLGLEVHFFVFDAERFRNGESLSLSAESSGSSQHCVLLDEFYRSALLVAGLPPLWWRVPADHDVEYDDYVRAASARRIIDLRDYIDFGGLPSIPAEEFFGAAVWQLYKSIDSPYKSVLKLLLMEAYAAEYPGITLLCARFKQAIESGQSDLNALDPYILMYTKVEEYLLGRADPIRLDVLRRCFYLKANVRVSELGPHTAVVDWRGEALRELVARWGWSQGRTVLLDQRDHWRLAVAIDERRDLTNTLKESYACLSRFARNHTSELTITEEDLHILGRKLYAAFEKKPSKIDLVTRGICSNPREPTLSLHEVRGGDEACVWLLYAGTVTPAETAFRRPLKRSGSAAEIVLWCHLNRLADLTTTWHVFTVASALNGQEVRRIHQLLEPRFSSDDSDVAAPGGELAPQPRLARVLLLVNVGVNPFSGTLSTGDVLTSDHNDPFRFGGRHINLVRAIDLLFMTTWNESFAFRYTGDAAVVDAIGECIGWLAGGADGTELPAVEARCFSIDHTQAIALRVQTAFVRGLRYLARRGRGVASHFVVETGATLQHIQADTSGVHRETHASTSLLMRSLGQARGRGFNTVCFDTGCARTALLATLYRHNRPRAVQIFAQTHGDRADVYILDERGVLLVQRQDCHTLEALFAHYRQFLEATLMRLSYGRDGRTAAPTVETCAIVSSQGKFSLEAHAADSAPNGTFLPLHVLADADSSGRQQFTVIAGQREFSTWEHGGSLFLQVAEYILAQRRDGQPYPIYITDLDLSTRFRQASEITTLRPLDLLRFKKRIEHQLTRALQRDVASNLVPLAS